MSTVSDPVTASGDTQLLLVDDDVDFCDALARALTRRGMAVTTAYGVDEALQTAERIAPDLAVVDLRIGEASGLQLVEQLCREDPEIKVVMLTAFASISTAVEAIKLGAVHYLTKPAEPDDILAAFERIDGDASVEPAPAPMSVRRLEWEHIQRVLAEHNNNISAAARALNMHRRTLQRKLQKHPMPR